MLEQYGTTQLVLYIQKKGIALREADIGDGGCVNVEVPLRAASHFRPADAQVDEGEVAHAPGARRRPVAFEHTIRLAGAREADPVDPWLAPFLHTF